MAQNSDPFYLCRFEQPQQQRGLPERLGDPYKVAPADMRNGRKVHHWMTQVPLLKSNQIGGD